MSTESAVTNFICQTCHICGLITIDVNRISQEENMCSTTVQPVFIHLFITCTCKLKKKYWMQIKKKEKKENDNNVCSV